MSNDRNLIAIDFDGVLHSYTTPWTDAATISDGPTEGAMEFLHDLHADGRFDTVIVSSRCKDEAGRRAILDWLHQNLGRAFGENMRADIMEPLQIIVHRPPAFLTIDDRAVIFEGQWPDLDAMAAFKPWNKRPPKETVEFITFEHATSEAFGFDIDVPEEATDEENVAAMKTALEGLAERVRNLPDRATVIRQRRTQLCDAILNGNLGRFGLRSERFEGSDGYAVWNVYMMDGTFAFSVPENAIPHDDEDTAINVVVAIKRTWEEGVRRAA